MPVDPIAKRRQRIDSIDRELVELMSRRAALAAEIGDMKHGDSYRPGREAQVLRAAIAANPGPLSDEEVARIMREVMSACLRLEMPLRVAYLGPAGTYTEAALYRFFGHGVTALPQADIDPVFRAVEAEDAQYGVVPIENSTGGAVSHTLDLLADADLRICGEITMPIHHHLLSHEKLDEIRVVRAHPQSFIQCHEWLETNLPHVERREASSNAEAARLAQEGGAAIASKVAAELYGLDIVASRIEDEPNNSTRFLVVGNQRVPPTGIDKTSLVLAARDRPGALVGLLQHFARAGINMTRIESRPSGRAPWEYHFFIDMEGHEEDPDVAGMLEAIQEEAAFCKVLGAYPAAVR